MTPMQTPTQEGQDDVAWIDAARLTQALEQFARERDWGQFHSPKNLVMALTGEVGELNEIFQWLTEAQSCEAGRDPETAQAVQDELADVLMYLLRLASVLGVDMNAAVAQKLRKNALRYPVAQSRGSRRKSCDLPPGR